MNSRRADAPVRNADRDCARSDNQAPDLKIESVDAVVVGAGIVGIAVARALALRGMEVVVLERHRRAGEEISSRNSGVIHSGIYYPPGSLKTRLCVQGRELLYEYCNERGIAHQRVGKLIVAPESRAGALRQLFGRGLANGVKDLVWSTPEEVRLIEPLVACAAAIVSPSTGIIDVHELLTSLRGDLEAHDGAIVFDSELCHADARDDGFTLRVRSGNEISEIASRRLVNSAGLNAVGLLPLIEGYPRERLRTAHFAKGSYFVCQGVKPFRHLVYPMPNEAGLGIHATLDLDGATRFGPDVEWTGSIDYTVDPARAALFYPAIREYWPTIPESCLKPGYAGIRPKLVGAGAMAADFEIEGWEQHGLPGLTNLLGIESPGLTACLAIGQEVARRVLGTGA